VSSHPFEDDERAYLVLVNAENQHSLWPVDIAVPDGWRTAHGPARRGTCLEYVEEHWPDIRPAGALGA